MFWPPRAWSYNTFIIFAIKNSWWCVTEFDDLLLLKKLCNKLTTNNTQVVVISNTFFWLKKYRSSINMQKTDTKYIFNYSACLRKPVGSWNSFVVSFFVYSRVPSTVSEYLCSVQKLHPSQTHTVALHLYSGVFLSMAILIHLSPI